MMRTLPCCSFPVSKRVMSISAIYWLCVIVNTVSIEGASMLFQLNQVHEHHYPVQSGRAMLLSLRLPDKTTVLLPKMCVGCMAKRKVLMDSKLVKRCHSHCNLYFAAFYIILYDDFNCITCAFVSVYTQPWRLCLALLA